MLPYQIIEGGSFTGDGSGMANIQISTKPDLFILTNRSDWGDDTAQAAIESKWKKGMADDSALLLAQAITTGALSSDVLTSGGFTFIDTANPPSYAALASTNVAGNTGTFVVTMAETGSIAVGDYVRLTSVVDEYQISGYVFQVTAVTNDVSITLGYMASAVSAGGLATFAAAGDSADVIKFIPNKMYPRWSYIAMITKASQAVVYFTAKNDYTPGEIVSFRVPSEFGMDEINNKAVRVLSVTNSATVSSITIDLDTSGYTTFAFPTSAIAAAGVSPAVVLPSSSGVVPDNGSATNAQQPPGTNLRDAFDNRNQYYMHCGPGVIPSTALESTYDWVSIKFDKYTSA
jgi:hypothetical protein